MVSCCIHQIAVVVRASQWLCLAVCSLVEEWHCLLACAAEFWEATNEAIHICLAVKLV